MSKKFFFNNEDAMKHLEKTLKTLSMSDLMHIKGGEYPQVAPPYAETLYTKTIVTNPHPKKEE